MRQLILVLTIVFLTVAAAPQTVEIREWNVPWVESRPRDPAVDAKGRVWFVGQKSHYIAALDPATGKFEKFDLEPGTGPHNLIVGPDGAIWFAGNLKAYIGRLDPATGTITKFPMPDAEARDPHTLVAAPNGDIWFTVQGGSYVGKLAPKSGEVKLIKVPTKGSRPYGIVIDDSGRPWFNEFGRNAMGTVDPKAMTLEEIPLADEKTRGRRIALAGDGIWYVDYGRGFLARLDPKTRRVEEWAAPGGSNSLPYAMASDDRGRLWFVETGPQPNRLVGFDPKTKSFFSVTEIPSGGSTVRHMIFHQPTRTIWFGTDANTIGRARVP